MKISGLFIDVTIILTRGIAFIVPPNTYFDRRFIIGNVLKCLPPHLQLQNIYTKINPFHTI